MAEGVELATAYISIVAEGSQIAPEVRRRFNQVGLDADRAGRDSGRRFSGGFGSALKRGAGLVGIGGLGVVAAGLVKSSISIEASFSKTMAQIGASTDGAAEHMGELNKLAMKLGAETSFSASDAAGAMLELGKAGINASDIMGGALQGTLLLAAAGSTDLATASTIAANAMNTFGLKGKDMNTIAAALAGGANASSASVESLGQALQQVGPGATNAGLSLQETVGALSAFDAAGIKGSDAGTALKTMLSRLVPQTDAAKNAMAKLGLKFTDAAGNFVPITNVAEQLKNKLGGLSEEQRTTALTTIFGSDATRAATVLMKQGSKGLAEYIKATKDQNAAQKLAKANMSGTAGALERLRGSVETAELALGKALAPTVEKVADFLSKDAVPAITEFITGMQDGTGAGGDFVDVAKDIVGVGKDVVGFFDGLPGPVKKFGAELVIALLIIGKVGPALAGAKASLLAFSTGVRTAETRMATMRAATGQLAGAGGMVLLAHSTQTANQSLGFLEKTAGGALLGFSLGGPIGAAVGAGAGALIGLATATHASAVEMVDGKKAAKEYADSLRGVVDASSAAARQKAIDVLNAPKNPGGTESPLPILTKQAAKLGIQQRDLVNIITGEAGARARVLAIARKAAKSSDEATRNAGNSTIFLLDRLDSERHKLKGVIADNKEHNRTVASLKELLKQLPAKAQTEIKALGGKATIADVKELARRYKLTPKQIQTVIEATGVKASVADIQSVINKMHTADKTRANPKIHVSVTSTGMPILDKIINLVGTTNLGVKVGARAGGGPVTAGQPYVVGEHRPELFVPNQSGRILPRVPAASRSGASSGSLAGTRLRLVVGGQEFDAYVDDRADGRVGAQGGIDGMTERAFG